MQGKYWKIDNLVSYWARWRTRFNEATGPQNHERQDQIHNEPVDTRLTRARRFKLRQQPGNLGDEVSHSGLDKIGPFERFHDRQERQQPADPCWSNSINNWEELRRIESTHWVTKSVIDQPDLLIKPSVEKAEADTRTPTNTSANTSILHGLATTIILSIYPPFCIHLSIFVFLIINLINLVQLDLFSFPTANSKVLEPLPKIHTIPCNSSYCSLHNRYLFTNLTAFYSARGLVLPICTSWLEGYYRLQAAEINTPIFHKNFGYYCQFYLDP